MRSTSISFVIRFVVACLAVHAAAYSTSSLANDRKNVQRKIQSVIDHMSETCKKAPGDCENTSEACPQKMAEVIGADVDLAVPVLMGNIKDQIDTGAKRSDSSSKNLKIDEWLWMFQAMCKVGTLAVLGPKAIPAILATARANELDEFASAHVGDAIAAMGPDALPQLRLAVKDDNVRIRKLAIYSLRGKEGAEILTSLLESERREDLRKMALNRLVTMASPRGKDSAADAGPLVKKLIAQLREPGVQTKLEALISLRSLYAAAAPAVPAVIDELKNTPRVRVAAMDVLMSIGPAARSAMATLKELLGDEDPQVRLRAAVTIGVIGPGKSGEQDAKLDREIVAMLIDRYRRDGWDSQLYYGKFGAVAVPLLLDVLKDPDPRMRKMAVVELQTALRESDYPVPPQLLAAAGDVDHNVRNAVSLSRIGTRAVPLLIEGLRNPNPSIRYTAASSLSGMKAGAKGAVGALTQSLEDRAVHIQVAACYALGEIGPDAQPAVPALMRKLGSEDNMQRCAIDVLGKIGPGAAPALLRLLRETIPKASPMQQEAHLKAQLAAIRILGAMRPRVAEAVEPIKVRLASTNSLERSAAIEALGGIGECDGSMTSLLIAHLQAETDPYTRIAAVYALGRVGVRDGSAIPALIKVLKTDPVSNVRLVTVNTLRDFGSRATNMIQQSPDPCASTASARQEPGLQPLNSRGDQLLGLLTMIREAFVSSPDVSQTSGLTREIEYRIEHLKKQAR